METHYKAVMKALEDLRYHGDLQTIFRDCIHAIALRCAVKTDPYRNAERLAEYTRTCDKYKKDEELFTKLIASICEMLAARAEHFGDHLGHIYMQLAPKGNHIGQFFTPYHISRLMAQINLGDAKAVIESKGQITVNDPCCGAGGMLVAACDYLNEQKINYTQHAVLYGNDIDLSCVEMSYLQLAFIGASAVIEHKCTFTQEQMDCYKTLGYLLTRGSK